MRRRGRHEAGISGARAGAVILQQGLEGDPPSGRERVDSQCAFKSVTWVIRRVQERIRLGDRHSLLRLTDFDGLVAGTYLTLLQDSQVEAGASTGGEQGGHARFVHPDAEAVARDTRLRHLEDRTSDAITVADGHSIIRQLVHREVLAKLAVDEVGTFQDLLPVAIGVDLIHIDCPLFPAVTRQVALSVSVKIQSADLAAAAHRILPDRGVHGATSPDHIPRKADVY